MIWSSQHRQLAVIGSLLLATGLCVALIVVRVERTGTAGYWGLLWNLLLAWAPTVAAFVAYNFYHSTWWPLRILVLPLSVIWLAFLPNAPYIVTDIMHLGTQGAVPIWYDVILLAAFAWTGCFLGLTSLVLMQEVVRHAMGVLAAWTFALVTLLLTGIGIYLGRFLRWNSWDLLYHPRAVIRDVMAPLLDPLGHFETVVFSLLFAALFVAMYLMVMALASFRHDAHAVPLVQVRSESLLTRDEINERR